MTDATPLLGIGELATRTGLPVRTIRFYSDSGVVPPAGRTDAGYRLYAPMRSASASCAHCATSESTSQRSGASSSAR
jgi:hypothetical protein